MKEKIRVPVACEAVTCGRCHLKKTIKDPRGNWEVTYFCRAFRKEMSVDNRDRPVRLKECVSAD